MFSSQREAAIWLAGLLEGEGYFTLQRKLPNQRGTLRVAVQMTDEDVVRRAWEAFPTTSSIIRRNGGAHGKRLGKPSYEASWNGKNAYVVMQAVLPYMGERRAAKIRECLSEWENFGV